MKIQDIIAEDKQVLDEFSTMDNDIYKALAAKGYSWLGKGVDQEAYLEPGGKTVLKIFGTQGNQGKLSADQKMFAEWADFCQKNSDNPFLPKFQAGRLLNSKANFICRLELNC